jgi:hypothetical protein
MYTVKCKILGNYVDDYEFGDNNPVWPTWDVGTRFRDTRPRIHINDRVYFRIPPSH